VLEILGSAETIEVSTGEVRAVSSGVLRASALGSCVAVAMLDAEAGVGGLAHVMLPGASPGDQRTKYAADGIRELIDAMTAQGAQPEKLVACMVGGGNILARDDDTICEANIRSATQILTEMGIRIVAREVGGRLRRSCALDVSGARVTYTVGDSERRTLWDKLGKATR